MAYAQRYTPTGSTSGLAGVASTSNRWTPTPEAVAQAAADPAKSSNPIGLNADGRFDVMRRGRISQKGIDVSAGEVDNLRVAQEQYNAYQDTYVPVENQFVQNVRDITKREKFETGAANADTQQAFSAAKRGSLRRAMMSGVAPGTGRAALQATGMGLDQADSGAKAGASASFSNKGRELTGLGKAISIGRDVSDQASLSSRDIARTSAYALQQSAQDSALRRGQNMEMIGTLAGAAASYGANSWGGFNGGTSSPAYGGSPPRRYSRGGLSAGM